jgi:hypothetical protein
MSLQEPEELDCSKSNWTRVLGFDETLRLLAYVLASLGTIDYGIIAELLASSIG